ncbi:hypothetical protein SSYRP_v1c09810 [Spiroplasma syrphidicola EA-1]|uniref:Lipoprotein n=1 Tax=Spiroplasma syrphidicola EA-1 TaxID=1276229 RepID=R4U7D9_9MOLU|nr:lipoprotein [Spiroplasma syrphidicola]AGM26568.1 hypothetical protein SSYRP_v1c09810 [Spiroplasma syrphidicola EA-1]
MKKLLAILSVTTLTTTSTTTLVACHAKVGNPTAKYFDSEIEKIDPVYRNQVKYTSTLAKILIASRHENMNTYALPTINYFLNNVGKNLKGTYLTKSGQEVKIDDYVNEYKKLNNFNWNPWKAANDQNYRGGPNTYNIMSTMVGMTKWDPKANDSHPTTAMDNGRYTAFSANQNVAWAQYDNGALSNTLIRDSEAIKNYIAAVGSQKWNRPYFNDNDRPGVSNFLYQNSAQFAPTTSEMSYQNSNKDNIVFGQAIANQSSNLNDLYGLKYFNMAINLLTAFQPGIELQLLQEFSQILPFAKTTYSSGPRNGALLLALPLVIASLITEKWFDSQKNVVDGASILQVFDKSVIETTTIKVSGKDLKLSDLAGTVLKEKTLPIAGDDSKQQYLDLNNPKHQDHQDLLLETTAQLSNWFKAAIAKAGASFNPEKLNDVLKTDLQKIIPDFEKIISSITMVDEATSLIRTVMSMVKSNSFDFYSLLRGMGGFANWFFNIDASGNYKINTDNVNNVIKVYNAEEDGVSGYNADLSSVDPKSDYGKLVLESYGFDSKTQSYQKGSLFDMFNIWAHGDSENLDSDNNMMYKFVQQVLNPESGYVGKMLKDINEAMRQDWFDNIFLDNKWHITASGKGVDNTDLGVVKMDGTNVASIRYQLDYYGPKDASTNLNKHVDPLGYTDPASGNSPSWIDQAGIDDRYNIEPEQSSQWSLKDWAEYDGNGSSYINHSDQIKYSYVVQFDNLVPELAPVNNISKDKYRSFLLTDFAWYYNDDRYY